MEISAEERVFFFRLEFTLALERCLPWNSFCLRERSPCKQIGSAVNVFLNRYLLYSDLYLRVELSLQICARLR